MICTDWQRNRAGKDVQQSGDGDGRRERWTDGEQLVNQEVQRISEEEVRPAMKRMKNRIGVGPDEEQSCNYRAAA